MPAKFNQLDQDQSRLVLTGPVPGLQLVATLVFKGPVSTSFNQSSPSCNWSLTFCSKIKTYIPPLNTLLPQLYALNK